MANRVQYEDGISKLGGCVYGEGKKRVCRVKTESGRGQHGPSSFRYGKLFFLFTRVRDKRHAQERTLGMEIREDGSPSDRPQRMHSEPHAIWLLHK